MGLPTPEVAMRSVVVLALGAALTAAADPPVEKKHVTPAQCEAVLLSLDDYFQGERDGKTIYVQAAPYVPPGLNRVGKYEAEVVTEDELKKRFAGKGGFAPSLAYIRADTETVKGEVRYKVAISYTGVPVPGARGIPLGGTKTFTYAGAAGKLRLLDSETIRH
jgi:hypothetical protein